MVSWYICISWCYQASGTETQEGDNEKNKLNDKAGQFTYPSIFLEYNVGRVSIGLDVIPGSVTTEESTRTDINIGDSAGVGNDGVLAGVTNKASVELSRHASLYALVPIMDTGAFARIALMRMDVETKENLGTGSQYPDTTMEGASVSLGYQHNTDAVFFRAELGYSDYGATEVTASNTSNKVKADLDGTWARISIGKSF